MNTHLSTIISKKKYPYPHKITALSISPLKEFPGRYPGVRTVAYRGDEFPFKDNEFSIVVSNAVVEHVRGQKQFLFIKEMRRVGQQFYFTTPAKEFPVELHTNYPFIHWLPKKIFDKFVTWIGKGWASGDYMNLLRKMDIKDLLKAANVKEFKILTHSVGPFPLHYAVWGR